MQKNSQSVYIANNLSDVLYHLKSVNQLQILGGCTQISKMEDKAVTVAPIEELCGFDKRERYIEFGSAITLSKMLELGRSNVPVVLFDAIETIGTNSIRNQATLGGNICAKGIKHTLFAPLLALDAKLEFKSYSETKNIFFNNFKSIPEAHVLTKIRVPTNDWEVEIFRRVGPSNRISDHSASFVFLVSTQNNIIVNVKVVFAGFVVFHSHELENKIIGTRLPLSQRTISELIKTADELYNKIENIKDSPPILKTQFLNLLQFSFEQLT